MTFEEFFQLSIDNENYREACKVTWDYQQAIVDRLKDIQGANEETMEQWSEHNDELKDQLSNANAKLEVYGELIRFWGNTLIIQGLVKNPFDNQIYHLLARHNNMTIEDLRTAYLRLFEASQQIKSPAELEKQG